MDSYFKKAINIIVVILLIVAIVIIANLVSKNSEYSETNNRLGITIATQENAMEALQNENNQLKQDNESLSTNISQLEDDKSKLQMDNDALYTQVQELTSKVKELEEKISKLNNANNNTTTTPRDFKSYMSYKAITSTSSRQWKLQQQATTDADGVRCIDGIPMVAVGTGWGLAVGDTAIVTCANGNSFKVVIGDIKSNAHTDAENKTTKSNGCRCEFIVDVPKLNSTAKVMGNMAVMSKYKGYVVNIEKV